MPIYECGINKLQWQSLLGEHANVRPSARHVGLALSTYGKINGKDNRPGIENLMASTKLRNKKTIMQALSELVNDGWAIKAPQRNSRGGFAQNYTLSVPRHVLPAPPAQGGDGPRPAGD